MKQKVCIISKKNQGNREIYPTGLEEKTKQNNKPLIISFPYFIVILLKSHLSYIYFITATKKFILLFKIKQPAFPSHLETINLFSVFVSLFLVF